jgi:glucose-6-phosphate isomerase
MTKGARSTKRYLSQLDGLYADGDAYRRARRGGGDRLAYEYYELGPPERAGDLSFGTSITYPGKIGDEYCMTRGHLHKISGTAEMYYTLSGEGRMLTENAEGDAVLHALGPGIAVYVPRHCAHRSINTGGTPLVTFYALRADAGHDYGTIEAKGFRNLVLEGSDGQPVLAENPRWRT